MGIKTKKLNKPIALTAAREEMNEYTIIYNYCKIAIYDIIGSMIP